MVNRHVTPRGQVWKWNFLENGFLGKWDFGENDAAGGLMVNRIMTPRGQD